MTLSFIRWTAAGLCWSLTHHIAAIVERGPVASAAERASTLCLKVEVHGSWVTNDRGVDDRSWIAGDVVGSDEFRMGISTTVGHRVRTRRRCFIFDDLHKYIGLRPRVSGCHHAMNR